MAGYSKISSIIPRTAPMTWSEELVKWLRNNLSLTQQGIDSAKQNYNWDLDTTGTPADMAEHNLYALPALAGLLPEVVGQSVKLEVFGSLANNGNGKTLRAYFGGTKIFDSGAITTSGGLGFYGFFTIYPTGVGTQKFRSLMFIHSLSPMTKIGTLSENIKTGVLRFTGQNSVSNLNDIELQGIEVELNKVQAPSY